MSDGARRRLKLLIAAFDMGRRGQKWERRLNEPVDDRLVGLPIFRALAINPAGMTIKGLARTFRTRLIASRHPRKVERLSEVALAMSAIVGAKIDVPSDVAPKHQVPRQIPSVQQRQQVPVAQPSERVKIPRSFETLLRMEQASRNRLFGLVGGASTNVLRLIFEGLEGTIKGAGSATYSNSMLVLVSFGTQERGSVLDLPATGLESEIRSFISSVRESRHSETVGEWLHRCSTRRLANETQVDRIRLAAEVQFRTWLPMLLQAVRVDRLARVNSCNVARPYVALPASTWLVKPTSERGGACSKEATKRLRATSGMGFVNFTRCSCGMPSVPGNGACAVCLQSVE